MLVHPAGGFRRDDRPEPDQEEAALQQPLRLQPREIAPQQRQIEAILRLHEIRARIELGGEPGRRPARLRIDRQIGAADEKPRPRLDRAAGGKRAILAQPPCRRHQHAAVDVIDRLRLGLVAVLRIVAMQAEDVRDAERRGPEQVGLQRHAVAVAHGELQHRLDPLARQDRGRRQRRHVGSGAGAVRNIDRVGEPLEAAGAGQHGARRGGIGRRGFSRHHELAGAEQRLEPAARLRLARRRPGHDSALPPEATSFASRSSVNSVSSRAAALAASASRSAPHSTGSARRHSAR